MSLTLELSLDWTSDSATHRDRYWYAGVDPHDSDLPPAFAEAIVKLGVGETAQIQVAAPRATLTAQVLATSETAAAGYLALQAALKNGLARQADLAALTKLAEPYTRPHADDIAFHAQPRLVDHLDATALEEWRKLTGRFIATGAAVLDLMASHDSHLPDTARPGRLVGLGMNATELDANPRLTERRVHDLNADPRLAFNDGEFDTVLCALSIEYLTRPEAVLREVLRVLKPAGCCLISFSERWFPPKAVEPWPTLHPYTRVAWVLRHLRRAGYDHLRTESLRGLPRPAGDKFIRQTRLADPLYAVWGKRPATGK